MKNSNIANIVKATFVAGLLNGCAGTVPGRECDGTRSIYPSDIEARRRATFDRLAEEYGGGFGMGESGDYLIISEARIPLRLIAAIQSGELVPEVVGTPDDFRMTVEGEMRGMPDDVVMNGLCAQADDNRDFIVEPAEAQRFSQRWMADYARQRLGPDKARGAYNAQNRKNLYNGRAR